MRRLSIEEYVDAGLRTAYCYHDRIDVSIYTPRQFDQFAVDGFKWVGECMICHKRVGINLEDVDYFE